MTLDVAWIMRLDEVIDQKWQSIDREI
ncbi:hypothetical protein CHELA20_52745 [Hyphomicrobiales bacterium]|nr:hypothetical protein CHELA41_22180 [Hyphomicrobiales bacterium]CAH1682793.1 hypothetical protein CHELA20_52745 [Hyphomicrobiales bacterium]